jgi:hypothetical protein
LNERPDYGIDAPVVVRNLLLADAEKDRRAEELMAATVHASARLL